MTNNIEHFYLVFQEDKLALIKNNNAYSFLHKSDVWPVRDRPIHAIEEREFNSYFAIEIDSQTILASDIQWLSLKEACHLLPPHYFSILSKAAQIILWDKQHQFCGFCGAKTRDEPNKLEKKCIECNAVFYSRIAPSIIVLIRKGEEILMARSPHFSPGVHALIAGFVEPGENLEEAVHREVFEEVGLKIKNLRYYNSQSWPFPNVLMLGFIADYESGDIVMQESEIESAGWYTKENLPGFPSYSFSISSQMIKAFVAGEFEH
jgi:NAD+ diphosphatase